MRKCTREERGFTITELAVVVLLMGIVSLITLNFLDNTTKVVGRTSATAQSEADARLALRTMLQDIRAAQNVATTYPVTTTCPSGGAYPAGYGFCLRFNVLHASNSTLTCPYSMITYGLVSGNLRQDRTDYDANCSVKSSYTGKLVIANVTNGTRPIFTYSDRYGNPLSTSTSAAAAFASAGVVNVQLYLKAAGAGAEFPIFSSAALRNNR
jgi:prepilin-type N-terminal cleavage/methylation domain-containing protein